MKKTIKNQDIEGYYTSNKLHEYYCINCKKIYTLKIGRYWCLCNNPPYTLYSGSKTDYIALENRIHNLIQHINN
jgi:hypothetical protein